MTERDEYQAGIQACVDWLLKRGLFQVAAQMREELTFKEED